MFLYVGSYLIIKSLRARSQAFSLLMLFLCVILHTMWSGKSLKLLCILPFNMLCLSAISMMFVKIMLTVCMCMCICFIVLGCAVSMRYIDVCNCDMFSVVNVYLDLLKFCVVCING